MPNPVWRLFVAKKMPEWLCWMRAQPSLEMLAFGIDQYVKNHPRITKKRIKKHDENFFRKMFVDEQFLNNLNPEGMRVAYNVKIEDILDEIRPYANKFPEIKWVYNILSKYKNWCQLNLNEIKRKYIVIKK